MENQMPGVKFEWDSAKNQLNIEKHGVDFYDAQKAFLDNKRVIAEDIEHSYKEKRFFCFGKVSYRIMTV